jgi:TonB family protein
MKKRLRVFVLTTVLLTGVWVIFSLAQHDQTIADKDIRVLDFEEMRYPPMARAARIQGVVVVNAMLDDTGHVKEANAISGADLLVSDSLINIRKWRFEANSRKSTVVVYHFEMPGVECKSTSSFFMFRGPNLATIIGCEVPVQTEASK